MIIFPCEVYIDSVLINSSDYEGIPFRSEELSVICIQPSWTGTIKGTLSIQGSNDGEIWSELPEGSINVNGANNTLINYSQIGWNYTRVAYTATSGSGTLRVTIAGRKNSEV